MRFLRLDVIVNFNTRHTAARHSLYTDFTNGKCFDKPYVCVINAPRISSYLSLNVYKERERLLVALKFSLFKK